MPTVGTPAALLLCGAGQEDRISKPFPGGSRHAASLAPPPCPNQHTIGEEMHTRFLLDGAFARSAIRKDGGSQPASQRSAASVILPAGIPPPPASACGIGPTLDADVAHATPIHQDISVAHIGEISTKEMHGCWRVAFVPDVLCGADCLYVRLWLPIHGGIRIKRQRRPSRARAPGARPASGDALQLVVCGGDSRLLAMPPCGDLLYPRRKASRSALKRSLWVLAMPCGAPS